MGVGVECKQEDTSNGEKSSSAVDNAKGISTTAIRTTPIEGESTVHQPQPPSMNKTVVQLPSVSTTVPIGTSTEPPSKRIKLENAEGTIVASVSNSGTVVTPVLANAVQNDPTPRTATITAPVAQSSSKLTTSTKPAMVIASTPTGHDTSTTSAASVGGTDSATQPQHAPTTTTAPTLPPQQSQGTNQSVSDSAGSKPSTEVTRSVPGKDEASSSTNSNSQAGPPSVVTASDESCPQHTSHSDNASGNSSNESLHESTTIPTAATSAASSAASSALPTSSTRLPNASSTTVASTPTTTVPPATSTNPRVQPCHPPTPSSLKPPATATQIPPPTRPPPVRTQVAPSTTSSASTSHPTTTAPVSREVPLKSVNFVHLRIKYLGELEYMLREFRKLERQLLGAKGAQQLEESQGSRERREKLHSFILHLEDTIRQIELGCKLEEEGKTATAENRDVATNSAGTTITNKSDTSVSATIVAAEEAKKQLAEESALSNLTKEKEEEETVQKLEEHILANLLPVKVRLKKQLAAQQGATQNPPGMPARRGSLQPSSAARGKGTFVEAVEKKRKHAESLRLAAQAQHERQVRSVTDPTQFGKPLRGVGSSLTKKLHGTTLGSSQRRTGHGVGSSAAPKDGQERKILHAGMVPKSTQQKSGLSAASGVHEIVTSGSQNEKNSAKLTNNKSVAITTAPAAPTTAVQPTPVKTPQAEPKNSAVVVKPKPNIAPKVEPTPATTATPSNSTSVEQSSKTVVNSSSAPLSEEDKLRFKKHRRLRKLKRLKRRRERELARQQQSKTQQQIPSSAQPTPNPNAVRKKPGHSKTGQKKKGPRVVEYICSQCSEAYSSTCDFNPWWALAQHKCPKCQKTQIPRIDISSPANAIEYHPALLSHLEDGGRGSGGSMAQNGPQAVVPAMPIVSQIPDGTNDINSESDSDLSELSDDNISIGSLKAAELESDLQSMTPAERAEHETFGSEYDGPVLSNEHAAKLLILIGHAATCPCQHKSEKHKEVCRSVKYMMLHVRDCPGTTSTFDVCPFPWCRKVKHLLFHLVSCTKPEQCAICSPKDIPKGLKDLVGLNAHRMKKHRERMIAAAKAIAAKNAKPNTVTTKKPNTKHTTPASGTSTKVAAQEPIAAVQNPVTAPVQAPVALNTVAAKTDMPFRPTATNVASVETRIADTTCVQNPVETKAHPVLAKAVTNPATQLATQPVAQPKVASNDLPPSMSLNNFNVYAEIAKLDVQLDTDAVDVPEALPLVVVKEDNNATMPVTISGVKNNAVACQPTNYSTMEVLPSETAAPQILPTPVDAIKMEDHDVDHAELRDLLATNIPMHSGLLPEVAAVEEGFYEYPLPPHEQQVSVQVTKHQQQIDIDSGGPGVDTLNDPNSDPLANINHEILIDSSDVSPSMLVPTTTDTNTCVSIKEEYTPA